MDDVITVGDHANILQITLDLGFCWDMGLDVDDLIHEGDVNLQVWERIYSGVFSG